MKKIDGVIHKFCCYCHKWLPLTEFRQATNKKRYYSGCRPCRNIKSKEWRLRTGYSGRYYIKNRHKIIAKSLQYYYDKKKEKSENNT